VEGLDGVLAAAQLSRCGAAAAAWCDEQGAANLEALELKPLERRRLEKVDIAVTEPEAPGGPTKIQLEGRGSSETRAERARKGASDAQQLHAHGVLHAVRFKGPWYDMM